MPLAEAILAAALCPGILLHVSKEAILKFNDQTGIKVTGYLGVSSLRYSIIKIKLKTDNPLHLFAAVAGSAQASSPQEV